MPKPQVSPKCQQYMKVFAVNNGSSAFISNVKRNVLTLTQVSGVAQKGERGLQLLRKPFPVSVLQGSSAQLE